MRYVITGGYNAAVADPLVVDVFINDALTPATTLQINGSSGPRSLLTAILVADLDPTAEYRIEIVVRSISSVNFKWLGGYGLALYNVELIQAPTATMTAVASAWPDNRPRALFLGDSTSEGVLARGLPANSLNGGADLAWPSLISRAKQLSPVNWSFGGAGMLTGFNDMPPIPATALTTAMGLPVNPVSEDIRNIFIMVGINDFAIGVTGSDFSVAYKSLLSTLTTVYPNLRKVFCVRDLFGNYQAEIEAVIAETGDPRLIFVNTNGWDIETADGVHFTANGNARFADLLGTAIGQLTN